MLTAKNIMRAYVVARKSRKTKQEVYMFDQNREERLLKMLDDLRNRNYIHGKYKEIILYDSKKRYIYSPGFRDHILHHLVYKQVYDLLDTKMTHSTFACRRGYGSHKAIKYLNKIIQKEEKKISSFGLQEKLYYLKLDFSKYFFSINHKILKEKIRKIIYNKDLLYCINIIIDSYKSPKNYDELLKDHGFYIKQLDKGLPIGGIISQIFANFYLNDLDQFLKHSQKVRFVRYMDDLIILGTKDKLNIVKQKIYDFLNKEKLILNPKKISFNLVKDGIKFVGYKIINNKIYVGKRIKKSFLKFSDSLSSLNLEKLNLSKEDNLRIKSMYYSRVGCFNITNFGDSFIKKYNPKSIL